MKKLAILTTCFAISAVVCAQPQVVTAKNIEPQLQKSESDVKPVDKIEKAAVIDFKKTDDVLSLKEMEYSFGKIPQGKPVTHIFEITNTGKEPLKISNVQASCGCTTPVWEQNKDIAPGQSSKITVGYNAASEGPFEKTITISYNNNQSKVIKIKGEVWKTPTESAPANKAVEGLKN